MHEEISCKMLGELLNNKHIATKQSMNLHLVEIEITH